MFIFLVVVDSYSFSLLQLFLDGLAAHHSLTFAGLQSHFYHLLFDVGARRSIVLHSLDTDGDRKWRVHLVFAVHHQLQLHVLSVLRFGLLNSRFYSWNVTRFDLLTKTTQTSRPFTVLALMSVVM